MMLKVLELETKNVTKYIFQIYTHTKLFLIAYFFLTKIIKYIYLVINIIACLCLDFFLCKMLDYHYYYFLLYNVNFNINQTRKYLKYKIKFKNYLDLPIIRNQGLKLKVEK